MVRIGEYSPNFRGNRPGVESVEGASQGIFCFGEYEEKRKYYNEQRKLEYKQYIAEQALKATCSRNSKNKPHLPTAATGVLVNCSRESTIATSVQREVSTQTANGERRDASTNTDAEVSRETHNNTQVNDHLINHSSSDDIQTDTYGVKKRDTAENETPCNLVPVPRDLLWSIRKPKCIFQSDGGLPGNLKQDSMNGLDVISKEKDRNHLNAITTAYGRELRAQIEEKKSHTRELQRREQQEEKSRERWLAEEASRELEKRGVEERKIKALEDCRRQRIEEFCNRSEQLQREAKEFRRMKIRDRREVTYNAMIGDQSDSNGKHCSSREATSQPTSNSIPKVQEIQSLKSDNVKLSREQCDTQERHLELGSIGQEVVKTAAKDWVSPKTIIPLCPVVEEDVCSNSSADQNHRNSNILSQLGEVRRQLATQQMKMEGAVKKIKSPDKTE